MVRFLLSGVAALTVWLSFGEIQVIDGVKYECSDGLCRIVEEPAAPVAAVVSDLPAPTRLAQGYMDAETFLAWLRNEPQPKSKEIDFSLIGLLLVLLGGLAMNLTPCVLPMVPINLMIIGKSAARGAWYGLGIATAYGALGVAAAIGGLAFGDIQGSPWFNLGIAILFIVLTLALSDVFFIDLSKRRGGLAQKKSAMLPWLFAFFMGAVSAVLAGACVAPILISVLLLTAKLYAGGHVMALSLPFVLGLGMALPWPFLGGGLQVLPKPGKWMKTVNRAFALLVFGFALWYGYLAWRGFARVAESAVRESPSIGRKALDATPSTFAAVLSDSLKTGRPVLVDCWATWCKNCAAMEKGTLEDEGVRSELDRFDVIRLQAEDMRALKGLKGFENVLGLPAFAVFECPRL